jgi:hypothetical protein
MLRISRQWIRVERLPRAFAIASTVLALSCCEMSGSGFNGMFNAITIRRYE